MRNALLLLALMLAPQVEARGRRVCASEGFSCIPGPCCHGTKCVDGVCRKPEKEWSDGPNPNEPTPDHPRPLKKDPPPSRKR
jgi:hypothetical protein